MKLKFFIINSLIVIFSCITIFAADTFKMCVNGHKNPEKAKFCVYCGLPLEANKNNTVIKETKQEPSKNQVPMKNEVQAPATVKVSAAKISIASPEKTTVGKESYQIICSKCGKKFTNLKIKFCTACGNNLTTNKSAAAVDYNQKTSDLSNQSDDNEIKTTPVKTVQQIAAEQKEELRKAEEEKQKQEEAKKAEIERQKAEEAKKIDEIRQKFNDLLKKGEDAFKNKYPRIALKHFEDALKIIPDSEDAIYNCGIINYYLKNYSDANLYFEMLLKKNNKDFEVLIYNGLTLYKLGLIEESKLAFKRILAFSDINSDYYKKAKEFFEKVK